MGPLSAPGTGWNSTANLRFGSLLTDTMPLSFVTQSEATSSRAEKSSPSPRIPPWMMPLMHSYSRDIAGVVLMRFVNGGSSFRTRRGSRGVRVANWSTVRAMETRRGQTILQV
jgi:hypothetical protein